MQKEEGGGGGRARGRGGEGQGVGGVASYYCLARPSLVQDRNVQSWFADPADLCMGAKDKGLFSFGAAELTKDSSERELIKFAPVCCDVR